MRQITYKTEKIEQVNIHCDDCGDRIFEKPYQCRACKKDLCYVHRVFAEFDLSGDYLGDYPHVYCRKCENVLNAFLPAINELREKYEKKLEFFEKKFLETCLMEKENK